MQFSHLLCLGLGVVVMVTAFPHMVDEFATTEGKRLIKTSQEKEAEWMTQDEIWVLISNYQNFIDVTDHTFPDINEEDMNVHAIPTTLRFQSIINNLMGMTNIPRMESFVQNFSSYHNRYYQSQTGIDSQKWLLAQVEQAAVNYMGQISVSEVTHSFGPQSSVVARITGADTNLRSEVVILGAHQDSINGAGSSQNAPGADDNASGAVVVLEALRVLVEAQFIPNRTIEFHFYAAEEVGLRGSAAIAQTYKNNGVNVVGMVNFDIPGYPTPGREEIAIYTDFVSAPLNAFLRLVINEYCEYTWTNRICGYGCSDHASFTAYGFPSVFPAEIVDHPQMHRVGDTIDKVDFRQVNEFVKLGLGFAVEMAEPALT